MKPQTINQLTTVLLELRKLNPDMNINMVLTLLEVARGNGVTGRDLENKLDLNHATAARMLKYFDKLQKAGKPGLDLFEARLDPVDYRAKLRYLNKKGEALVGRLGELMEKR